MMLCERINSKDNNPPYRDEQRAWYDTLRDFLPALIGFKPTIRLFTWDFVWCSLDPDNPSDIRRFKNILKRISQAWEIEAREEEISKKIREPSYDIILNISDEWPYILDISLTIDSPFANDTIKDQVEEIMDIVTEKIRKIFEECGLKEAY